MLRSVLVGPLPVTGMGFQYFITAIDDYYCYAMVGLLRHKSDAVSALWDILVNTKTVQHRNDNISPKKQENTIVRNLKNQSGQGEAGATIWQAPPPPRKAKRGMGQARRSR